MWCRNRMKKNFRLWVASAVGITAAFTFSSCAYDPYYSSVGGSYSSGYSSGYGEGYGYGGSNFSTSLFVTTGDPRWGYDPGCHSYYDYRSRRYYDPYLYGYYPVGYRPVMVYGAPHPYGWQPGRSYCPPPRTVRNVTVVNYQNRESAYRNSDYSWAKKVHSQPSTHHRTQRQEPSRSSYGSPKTYDQSSSSTPSTRTSPYARTNPFNRDSYKSRQPLERVAAPSRSQTQRESESTRHKQSERHSSRYSNQAAEAPSRQPDFSQPYSRTQRESHRPSAPPSHSRTRNESRPTPPANKRDAERNRSEESKSEPGIKQRIRSLGEG